MTLKTQMLICPTAGVVEAKKGLQSESPARLNGSSGSSKADCQELKAEAAPPVPSREASVDCFKVSSNGDVQDPEPINLRQEQVR